MRKIGIIVLLMCFALSTESLGASSRFAAKVNGVFIKSSSVDAALINYVENKELLGAGVSEQDKAQLRKSILDQLIAAELLYQESKKSGISVGSSDIEEEFERIKMGFGDEKTFKEVLEARGITEEDLKEDVRKGIYINSFLDKQIYEDFTITEEQKKEEYEKNKNKLRSAEEIRASHILIRANRDAGPAEKKEAKDKIDLLRRKALAGEDFAKLARENSEDGSASTGGDLGFFKRGDMIKSFEDVAFSLKEGDISEVIQTDFGYHIIKLTDRRPERIFTYEEVERDIEAFLTEQRKAKMVNDFIVGLKQNADITYY